MKLTTHVLDISTGTPASSIALALHRIDGETVTRLAGATTNADGRCDAPLAEALEPGCYQLTFTVAPYFARNAVAAFYDEITVRFRIDDPERDYHVPLLLGPWGYTTYRGS